MTDAAISRARQSLSARRFIRTPKALVLAVLVLLVAVAGWRAGWTVALPGVAAATLVAAAVDAPILRIRKRRWVFPDGAIITALIVAMILSPNGPWYLAGGTAAAAVLSKYLVRSRTANVFNPAALALVAAFHLFHPAESWWGALPDVAPAAVALLMVAGGYVTAKVNKVPVVLAFLGTYYLLVTVAAFAGNPGRVAELYRAPDLQAALFFAFFMVTDPPTSPPGYRDQVACGAIAAVVGVAVFELAGSADYLLAGLLVANVWEAWRRSRSRRARFLHPVIAS